MKYKNQFMLDYTKSKKKKQLETKEQKDAFKNSFDWHRMTAQDKDVWSKIFAHLES